MNTKEFFRVIFSFFFLIIFSSCAYDTKISNQVSKFVNHDIFIPMPENRLVFDNFSPYLYKALFRCYSQLGYSLVSKKTRAFYLRSKIEKLSPMYKDISPDLLLYNRKLKLELSCQLLDIDGKLIKQKKFTFFRLMSEPKDPILSSNFTDFIYDKLAKDAALKIERYFRKYLIE